MLVFGRRRGLDLVMPMGGITGSRLRMIGADAADAADGAEAADDDDDAAAAADLMLPTGIRRNSRRSRVKSSIRLAAMGPAGISLAAPAGTTSRVRPGVPPSAGGSPGRSHPGR